MKNINLKNFVNFTFLLCSFGFIAAPQENKLAEKKASEEAINQKATKSDAKMQEYYATLDIDKNAIQENRLKKEWARFYEKTSENVGMAGLAFAAIGFVARLLYLQE